MVLVINHLDNTTASEDLKHKSHGSLARGHYKTVLDWKAWLKSPKFSFWVTSLEKQHDWYILAECRAVTSASAMVVCCHRR